MYQSTKVIKGFSTCFRQWKAVQSHCSFLHGYALKFKLTFEANTLDERNWVQDFGFTKQQIKDPGNLRLQGKTIKDWFSHMFDHTTLVAYDDPFYNVLEALALNDLIDLRGVEKVGCEAFAELVYYFIQEQLAKQGNKVFLLSVECMENEDNSAIFIKK